MEPKVFDPSLMENRFRHEFKYECSYAQLKNLQCRLSGLIPLDPHAGEDGIYNIRRDRLLRSQKGRRLF